MAKLEQITVRFKSDDMAKIKARAEQEPRPPANFITWVVLQYVKAHGEDVASELDNSR